MAKKKRRVRIPLGFSSGGRSALIGSLLPTAAEQAEASRLRRTEINNKISAFNREEISIEELAAYLEERIGLATDAEEKSSLQSALADAKSADKKRANAKLANDAKNAVLDFQAGNATYADTVASLRAARARSTDSELTAAIGRYEDDAGRLNIERQLNTKVEDFNKGKIKYAEFTAFINEQLGKTDNELVRAELTKKLDESRKAENARLMTEATDSYNSGRTTIEEFVARMDALRNDPTQKDPDQLEQIAAAIGAAEANEQAIEDQRMYTMWQTHQKSDQEAINYFNSRQLAETRNPKVNEAMGKYAANIQARIDSDKEKAERMSGSVRSSMTESATKAMEQRDADVAAVWNQWLKFDMPKLIKAAKGDTVTILDIAKENDRMLGKLALNAGFDAKRYQMFQDHSDKYFTEALASSVWNEYTSDLAQIRKDFFGATTKTTQNEEGESETVEVQGQGISDKSYVTGQLEIARKASEILASAFAMPGMKRNAEYDRNWALDRSKDRIEQIETTSQRAYSDIVGSFKGLYDRLSHPANAAGLKYLSDNKITTFEGYLGLAEGNFRQVYTDSLSMSQGSKPMDFAEQERIVDAEMAKVYTYEDTRTQVLGGEVDADGNRTVHKDVPGSGLANPTPTAQLLIDQYNELSDSWLREAFPNSYGALDIVEGPQGRGLLTAIYREEARDEAEGMVKDKVDHFKNRPHPQADISDTDPKHAAFHQPFLGAERANDISDRMIIFNDDGFPKWFPPGGGLPIVPVSPNEIPLLDEDGVPIPDGARAFMLLQATLGAFKENIRRSVGERVMWHQDYQAARKAQWEGDQEAVTEAIEKLTSGGIKVFGDVMDFAGDFLGEVGKFSEEGQENFRDQEAGRQADLAQVAPINLTSQITTMWDNITSLFTQQVAGGEPQYPEWAVRPEDRNTYIQGLLTKIETRPITSNMPGDDQQITPAIDQTPISQVDPMTQISQPNTIHPSEWFTSMSGGASFDEGFTFTPYTPIAAPDYDIPDFQSVDWGAPEPLYNPGGNYPTQGYEQPSFELPTIDGWQSDWNDPQAPGGGGPY